MDRSVTSITCVTFYKPVFEISAHDGDSQGLGLASLDGDAGRLLAGTIASSLLKSSVRVGNLATGLTVGSAISLPGAIAGSADSEEIDVLGSIKTLLLISFGEVVPFHSRGGKDCPVWKKLAPGRWEA